MSENGKNAEREFWDISSLVDKKDKVPSAFSHPVKLATVFDNSADEKAADTEEKLTLTLDKSSITLKCEQMQSTNAFSYTPADNALIKRVTVTDEPDGFNFYATFKEDAQKLFYMEGSECPYASYFSYVPQYIQLTDAQKNYYLWWRTCMRHGENIKSDYSYFWLYVYEIINLPDIIPPKDGVKMLCRVWRDYRNVLPNVDKNMMVWLCDYCLLHGLPCPSDELADFLPLVIEETEFKEFYLGQKNFDELNVNYIVCASSDYNWHKSKILRSEKAKTLFNQHMNAAIHAPIRELWEKGDISLSSECVHTLSYSAFRRSLCGYFNKKHIDVEYCSLTHTQSIRAVITMIVKYAENKLRAMLAVKSRLAIINLPEKYKSLIDDYFSLLPDNNVKKAQQRPEYEKLYDALDNSISIESASEIESSSWDVARLLTEDADEKETREKDMGGSVFFEQIEENDVSFKCQNSEHALQGCECQVCDENYPSDSYGLSSEHVDFIRALIEDDRESISRISSSLGKTAQSISEYINEKFFDGFGDVIIEITENTCEILPDYRQELEQWLNS